MTTLTTAGRQVHADTHDGRRVVVGVDNSPAGLAALRWAVRFARSRGAQLVAVRVWELSMRRRGGHRGPGNGRGHVVLAFPGAQQRQVAANLTERAHAGRWCPWRPRPDHRDARRQSWPRADRDHLGDGGCARGGQHTRPPAVARRSWLGQCLLRQAFALPGHRRRGQPPRAVWWIGSKGLMRRVRAARRRQHGRDPAGCRGRLRRRAGDAPRDVAGQHLPALLQHEPGGGRATRPRRICREPAAGSCRPAGLAGRGAGRRGQLRGRAEPRHGGDRLRRRRPRCTAGAWPPCCSSTWCRPAGQRGVADLHRRGAGGERRDAAGVRRRGAAGPAQAGGRRHRADLRPARWRRRPGLGALPGRGGRAGGPGRRGQPAARAGRGVGGGDRRQPEAGIGRPGDPAQHRHRRLRRARVRGQPARRELEGVPCLPSAADAARAGGPGGGGGARRQPSWTWPRNAGSGGSGRWW